MKKIFYSALCVAALATTSCSDFLETSSPSVVDGDFVFSNMTTARAAMDGTYEAFRDAIQNDLFGDGFYYAMDVTGSDIERHPESYTAQLPRHEPECFYVNGTVTGSYVATGYQKESPSNGYARSFKTISNANAVISAMEQMPGFDEQIAAGQPTDILNLYGEAVAIRATCYRELIKYYGDVPYNDTFGEPAGQLVGRDSIFEACIADLIRVEPIMYRLGENGTEKNQISRSYVQGLIGRMAMEAAGYHTRRSDITYRDIEGKEIQFEQIGKANASAENAVYNRRTDYKKFYEIAKTYFGMCLQNSGTAQLLLTDPRANGDAGNRQYNNPYQYFFEEMHMGDEHYATESIYEIAMTMGSGNDARPYSFGRPSAGGSKLSKNAGMPCKNYGQGRINPAFYYGMFDPNDMRRDVSIAVTGSKGDGSEKLIPMKPGSQTNGGGLSLNKWDENRQAKPYTGQRKSGINAPYMRMAEIYVGYAEACAMTGDEATAKQYLKIIRERSFPAGKANTDAFIAKYATLQEAIIDERGFEYAGEGDRRYTLIRSGFIAKKIKATKELTKAMIDGLKANGYYEFENGNVISDYVYTKLVDAKKMLGYRLTAQCPENATGEEKAVLYPSWRGQHDNWESICAAGGFTFAGAAENTNLAIQGLFEQVDGAALEAAGYTKVEWGKALVANEEDYYNKYFNGYDFESAPVYVWPFTPNIIATGGFRNGYGFMN